MSITGHGAEKYRDGRMFVSSAGRGWQNLLAERRSHPQGELPSIEPHDTEIAIQLVGRTFVERQGGGIRECTNGVKGTVWLCPAGITEEFINIHAEIPDCLHIYLPSKPFSNALLEDLDIDPSRVALRYRSSQNDPFIAELSERILMELMHETSSGRLLVGALSGALSAHLVSQYTEEPVKKKSNPIRSQLDSLRLARVIDFVEANLHREFGIAELADVACLSASHLARGFKAATGRTLHGFVSAQRFEMAKRLLVKEDKPLAEVAYDSGFSSQANFARAFRRVVNMTPGQYRARFTRRDRSGAERPV